MARYKRQPFIEATMEDPSYRLIEEGTFQNVATEMIRNCQNPEKEEAFLSLLLQMLHPNPIERPSMKDVLARPLWDHLKAYNPSH